MMPQHRQFSHNKKKKKKKKIIAHLPWRLISQEFKLSRLPSLNSGNIFCKLNVCPFAFCGACKVTDSLSWLQAHTVVHNDAPATPLSSVVPVVPKFAGLFPPVPPQTVTVPRFAQATVSPGAADTTNSNGNGYTNAAIAGAYTAVAAAEIELSSSAAAAALSKTSWDLLQLRVGSHFCAASPSCTLKLELNVVSSDLSFVQVDHSNDEGEKRILIPELGLQDIFIIYNPAVGADFIELLFETRVTVSSVGPSQYNWTKGLHPTVRGLIAVRLASHTAQSVLFCLASGMCEDIDRFGFNGLERTNASWFPSDSSTSEKQEIAQTVTFLCATIRKALIRRDFLTRGWSDSLLTEDVLRDLLITPQDAIALPGLPGHHMQSNTLPAASRFAPQLAHHCLEREKIRDVAGMMAPPPKKQQKQQLLQEAAEAYEQEMDEKDTVIGHNKRDYLSEDGNGMDEDQQTSLLFLQLLQTEKERQTKESIELMAKKRAKLERDADAAAAAEAEIARAVVAAAESGAQPEETPVYRPKTAYQLYHKFRMSELRKSMPHLKHQEAFRKAALDWSKLSEEEQQVWMERADLKRAPPEEIQKKREVYRQRVKELRRKARETAAEKEKSLHPAGPRRRK
jgi:hypothetical protein